MSTNTDKQPLDRETKVMLLGVFAKGFFEKADLELLVRKNTALRYDDEELKGSIPIHDWIRWRNKENAKTKESA